MRKIDRQIEVKQLKNKIKDLLTEMNVSRSAFERTLPRMKRTPHQEKMENSGYQYKIDGNGKKPSVRQKYQYLMDLKSFKTKMDEKEKEKSNEE